MVNLKTQIPSETPGDVVSIQRGRAAISLSKEELEFLVNINTLLHLSDFNTTVTPPVSEVANA